jgi:hypothetical protein
MDLYTEIMVTDDNTNINIGTINCRFLPDVGDAIEIQLPAYRWLGTVVNRTFQYVSGDSERADGEYITLFCQPE